MGAENAGIDEKLEPKPFDFAFLNESMALSGPLSTRSPRRIAAISWPYSFSSACCLALNSARLHSPFSPDVVLYFLVSDARHPSIWGIFSFRPPKDASEVDRVRAA